MLCATYLWIFADSTGVKNVPTHLFSLEPKIIHEFSSGGLSVTRREGYPSSEIFVLFGFAFSCCFESWLVYMSLWSDATYYFLNSTVKSKPEDVWPRLPPRHAAVAVDKVGATCALQLKSLSCSIWPHSKTFVATISICRKIFTPKQSQFANFLHLHFR